MAALEQDAHKMSDAETRDKRNITAYVAGQVMRLVTQVAYRDQYGVLLDIEHKIVLYSGDARLGTYAVQIKADEHVVTHVFDLQMMMDLRSGWQAYAEERTLQLLRDLFKKVDEA